LILLPSSALLFFFNDTPPTALSTLSLHDALPICAPCRDHGLSRVYGTLYRAVGGRYAHHRYRGNQRTQLARYRRPRAQREIAPRSEEHTSELQSRSDLVCRLLLEKKKKKKTTY